MEMPDVIYACPHSDHQYYWTSEWAANGWNAETYHHDRIVQSLKAANKAYHTALGQRDKRIAQLEAAIEARGYDVP